MKRREIEALRERVGCAAVLERASFAIDFEESSRRAIKFRRGGEIIIVTHVRVRRGTSQQPAYRDCLALVVVAMAKAFSRTGATLARLRAGRNGPPPLTIGPCNLTTGMVMPFLRNRFGSSFLQNPAISNPSLSGRTITSMTIGIHVCAGTTNAMAAFSKTSALKTAD